LFVASSDEYPDGFNEAILLCVQIKESRKRPKNNEACISEYTSVAAYVTYYRL